MQKISPKYPILWLGFTKSVKVLGFYGKAPKLSLTLIQHTVNVSSTNPGHMCLYPCVRTALVGAVLIRQEKGLTGGPRICSAA